MDLHEEKVDAVLRLRERLDLIYQGRPRNAAADRAFAVRALLAEVGEPIVSSTLILPGEEMPLMDPYDMQQTIGHALDLIIDGGYCGF